MRGEQGRGECEWSASCSLLALANEATAASAAESSLWPCCAGPRRRMPLPPVPGRPLEVNGLACVNCLWARPTLAKKADGVVLRGASSYRCLIGVWFGENQRANIVNL
jgi:hypothetical protein